MAAVVDDRTLRLTRRFDASPERLFDAWTDQAQFAEWFGPQGLTTVYCDLDPHTGGAWRLLGRNSERTFAVSGRSALSSPSHGTTRATTPSRASKKRQ